METGIINVSSCPPPFVSLLMLPPHPYFFFLLKPAYAVLGLHICVSSVILSVLSPSSFYPARFQEDGSS